MAPQSNGSHRNATPTSPPFRFYLLGELRIAYRGAPIDPPPYRTHSLLAALLLHPQHPRREWLAGLLFPERSERDGRRRLSDALWLLRRALPDLPLETSRQEIFLPLEHRWLDIEAFQRAAASDDPSRWRDVLALYRGDLLESVYADWLLEDREHLYLRYVRLLHRTCGLLARARQFDDMVPLAERLVQIEPYDEQALRGLMRAYRALGRRGAALAAYERFVALAADELGVAPEPATRALADSIRGMEATPCAPVPAPSPAAPAATDPDALLTHAQQALHRGDRACLHADLAQLRRLLPTADARLCLLEIDAALYFEAYDRAAHLLAPCSEQRAPVLVRLARLALKRHEKATALAIASQALVAASEASDPVSEIEALIVLAQAQSEVGQGVQGARSAEQALNLARAAASPVNIGEALLTGGHLQQNLGHRTRALAMYREAEALAQTHGLRRILADALYRISRLLGDQGALLDAKSAARAALSLWRDLGVQEAEIHAAYALGLFHALLGDTAECLRIVERIGAICEALGDPVQIAIHQYHLADTLLYHGEACAPRAVEVARAALSVFQAHDLPEWAASTLSTLGYALWIEGQDAAALDACCRAEALHRRLEEMDFLPGLLSLKGLICLSMDDAASALATTRQALQIAMLGSAISDALPEVYYAHAMALAAHGEEAHARDYLRRAYEHLVTEAAQHENEAARQALFHRSPITRRLMRELHARGIAPPPEAKVVTREAPAARGDARLRVRWTVDAGPADAALKHAQGAIALRRARLARLRREAEAQGAHPTIAQLADALNVSARTIKRDLAALRESAK